MAVTVTVDNTELVGRKRQKRGTITFDSSYPTGGEAVTPADFGLVAITDMQFEGDDGYVLRWDRSTTSPKVMAYWVDTTTDGAPMAEVANTTNLSAVVSRFTVTGY